MAEKSIDRRTLKTRKAIRDAFAEILTEKELSKVTVREITEKADINRATFYKHYLDIYDLYDKTEQEILVELGMLVLRLQELPSDKIFSSLIDYIDENRTVFRMIFSVNSKSAMREKFSKCMDGLFRQIEAEKKSIDLNDSRLMYQTCYRSQGCIAVIAKWVSDAYTEPKEFIVNLISELDMNTEKIIISATRTRKKK